MSRILELQAEQDKRAREGIKVYRPTEFQRPVHTSTARELLVAGGKRAGKTVAVSDEVASRITGIPINLSDTEQAPMKWPVSTLDYPRTYWFIGFDLAHIGQTIHRVMFKPGMGGTFRCIKDEDTGRWRPWNRADKSDVARVKESHLTEPLIPDRFIVPDSWEWEDKRGNKFKSVELVNGAKIYAFPSTGIQPKQGDAVSGIWIDEDIAFPEHIKEWQDRLTDENGWLIWSVWPHMKNPALISLIERAEASAMEEKPIIQRVQLVMTKNPFIPEKSKEDALARMGSDEEVARRDRGDVNMDSFSMYNYESKVHSLRRHNASYIYEPERPPAYLALRKVYELIGALPNDWTRYLFLDPSHTRTGVQSWVVPPSIVDGTYIGNVMICEWDLVLKRLTAEMIAKIIADRRGSRHYEAHVIDNHAGRQTHAGRDTTTSMLFSQAFREYGLKSRQTGYGFASGCDIPPRRYQSVRSLMVVNQGIGIPSLMLVEDKCTETIREFTKYMKKRMSREVDSDAVLDEPANPRLYDLMACTEYAAHYIETLFEQGSAYVEPSAYKSEGSAAYRHAMKLRQKVGDEQGVVTL